MRASRLPALEQGLGFWFLALQSKAERLFWLLGGPALQNFPNKSLGLFLTDIFWRGFPPAGREGPDLLIFQKIFIQLSEYSNGGGERDNEFGQTRCASPA